MEQPISIFRFSFKSEIMEKIAHFAKTHQHDDRKTYKEAWQKWFIENNVVLEDEIIRLTRIGYIGNVEYKMFNAGRYYFRKKSDTNANTNTNDDEIEASKSIPPTASTKKPRVYISTDKIILDAMDQHIRASLATAAQENTRFTPANGYNQFCKMHIQILGKEIKRIYNALDSTNTQISKLIVQKFKKTYKNRYFTITHK